MAADVTYSDGQFLKSNDPRISDIESRIYTALGNAPELETLGVKMPAQKVSEDGKLQVEYCGRTLMDYVHSGEEGITELRARFEGFLEQNIKVRGVVNRTIHQTLTEEDKLFLQEYHLQKLVSGLEKQFGKAFEKQEVKDNFWAYRVMNAIGHYDEEFKRIYTENMGKRLDQYAERFGTWLSDNTLRNNATPDGITLIPFDFDSIKYGPRQMDDGAFAGMYCFDGPLGMYHSVDEVRKMVEDIQQMQGREADPEYFDAFLLCAIHENAVIAGYRTKKTKQLLKEMEQKGVSPELAFEFRHNFDEIEYHSAAADLIWRSCSRQLVADEEKRREFSGVIWKIDEKTFGQRCPMMFSPAYQKAIWVTDELRGFNPPEDRTITIKF